MAAMPLGEWTRRLGVLPAEAYYCFSCAPLMEINQVFKFCANRKILGCRGDKELERFCGYGDVRRDPTCPILREQLGRRPGSSISVANDVAGVVQFVIVDGGRKRRCSIVYGPEPGKGLGITGLECSCCWHRALSRRTSTAMSCAAPRPRQNLPSMYPAAIPHSNRSTTFSSTHSHKRTRATSEASDSFVGPRAPSLRQAVAC